MPSEESLITIASIGIASLFLIANAFYVAWVRRNHGEE
jgi:hypothetical protein